MEVSTALGRVGLPAPIAELAARDWDAVVVGGGHNGLAAAAYLARAGQSVLVLERRERLGGACTLEQPFDDERFLVSPCAYVVGLLDQLVIDELDLPTPRLQRDAGRPQPLVPVPGRHLLRPVPGRPRHRRPHGRERLLGARTSAACSPTRRPSIGSADCSAPGRPATSGAGPRPAASELEEILGRRRADLDRLRGADRRDARPLRLRRASRPRPLRAGNHRRRGPDRRTRAPPPSS